MAVDKYSLFRIVSFSLAGGDVLQTMPGTYRLYRKQRGIPSPMCFFYAMARYMSIISLVSNGIGFFSTSFTPESCRRFYMLPNVTAMLAGMAVQVLIFIRTYAISGRSKYVWFGLGFFMILCFPVQVFGITHHRRPFLSHGGCKGRVLPLGETDWNIVYYSSHMAFDLVACATATLYLILSAQIRGVFNASKFVRRVLRNGLLYTLVVFIANLWVVIEFAGVFSTGAASTLPLAVVMIAAQHLILSTQLPTRDRPSSLDDYPTAADPSSNVSGPARFYNENNSQPDVELQSGVFVVTEAYRTSPADDQKAGYESADRPVHPGAKESLSDAPRAL
ncbi:hypothetical protein B0H15DRAFT_127669 [Mycena belliarum]|uniref:Uncharacterized protein n=1 Tax=Mycena belliarum TaxID=1033014 RepID=A0AAD6U9E3_9AGAR|nr:hypothetical protein B0H15DRAFT_127669 [Mycena belliae]